MIKKIILFLFLTQAFASTYGQISYDCDDFTFRSTEFDSLIQHEYISNKADTLLAARHTYTTNGIGKAFAVICWKENGKFHFKLFTRKNNEIKTKTELTNLERQHISSFFTNGIYKNNKNLNQNYFIDDASFSLIIFYSKDFCWRLVIGSSKDMDDRVIWMRELINIIRL